MMCIKETINRLEVEVLKAKMQLDALQNDLYLAKSDIRNHVYESLEQAEDVLMNMFEHQAHEDCEGSYNIGNEEYTQDFIVDGKEYTATGTFEYNRHDKTYYYYVEDSIYSYKEKF